MKRLLALSTALVLAGCGDSKTQNEAVGPAEPEATYERPAPNPTKNAYFGDTHVHTKNSFDAFIVGTRTTADDAYRFAKGEAIDNGSGHQIQLDGPPLDFYSVTDHGEYMGVVAAMRDRKNPISKTETAKSVFGLFGGSVEDRTNAFIKIGTTIVTGEPIEDIYDRDFIDSAWAFNVAAAEKHYQPGKFTTFAGYEFTAMEVIGDINANLGAINLHRNVIFEDEAPTRLFTTLVSPNPEDLWDWMNEQRAGGTNVLAIPHNSNGSNGQIFDTAMTDGSPLTEAYARNRILNEPIVEISQIKGTSETHPQLSPNDEWSDFELYDILIGMPVKADIEDGSFVRPSLARGIALGEQLGTNPYQFGITAASDTHVSAPSVSEENHFGKFASDLEPETRGSTPPKGQKTWGEKADEEGWALIAATQYAAAGLGGVWAEENTRESIFAGMQNKETFGTSGPRMQVRMFAGDYSEDILAAPDMLEQAYASGTAMGGEVSGTNPTFLAWATRDPNSAPLQRLQMIKVWHQGGDPQEAIYDIACSSGSAPDPATNRCPDNGAEVNLSDCSIRGEGATELKALWQDPNYTADQTSSYYLRVLENPTCRWSTWDAVRNGTPPNPDMHATLQERAWGSPIWLKP